MASSKSRDAGRKIRHRIGWKRSQRVAKHSLVPTGLSIEPLEKRMMLADFGDITNPATLRFVNDQPIDQVLFDLDSHSFTLGRSAVVIAKLSDAQKSSEADVADGSLRIFGSGGVLMGRVSLNDGELRVSLPPGGYSVNVNPFRDLSRYDLAIHADTALGSRNVSSSNPTSTLSALTGRDLGTLSTTTGFDQTEYVGFGGPSVLNDDLDMYFFNVVKQGTVEFTVDAGVSNDFQIDLNIFRDFDGDNVFEPGTAEQIVTRTGIRPGQTRVVSRNLPPARYGIAITPVNSDLSQGNNYRLRTAYTVVDGAGNTLAAAKDAFTVGNANVNFNDYLSSSDPFDIYKFTTVAGGPFVFEGTLSGMATGSNFELDFIRDLDKDGVIDANELTSSDRTGNVNDELSVPFSTVGIHFVRVRRTAGEGIYTLVFSNRNTDIAGNTTAAALNFGDLFGLREFNDGVSSTDTDDFYKFTLERQSEFSARLAGMPIGTNANLALLQSNGAVIQSSNNANNAVENVTQNLPAGTYFVRVLRISGAPTYNLRLVKDSVGETLAAALTISPTGDTEFDFLGSEDNTDVYRFTLGSTRLVGVAMGQGLNNEPLSVRLGKDTNGNGTLDGAELQINKIIAPGGELERINLTAGTYFLVMSAVIQDEGTTYAVTVFNEKPDFAGNTLDKARNLGTLSSAQSFVDFVGDGSLDLMDDLDDFYRFTLGNTGPFQFQSFLNILPSAGNPPRSVLVELIRDDNLDQVSGNGELVASAVAIVSGVAVPGVINTILNVPGTYYLQVKRNSGQVDYNLSLSTISLDAAGNTLVAASDLGQLTGTTNSVNHFVGRIDLDDFFRFSVNSPGELLANLSGAAEPLDIEVIRDVDNDLVVDSGETLASSASFVGPNDRLHGVLLSAAGNNYYVRVRTNGGDSSYNLSLTFSIQTPFATPFQISATAPTEIKAVRFDKGGEGVSYHDTTPGNNGDQPGFRIGENIDVDVSNTVDPVSTGRRVTNTAPGEFLEYTLNVAENGLYDLDVRVSSPDLGASFHLDIDGISLSAPIAVPDTNGADNMILVSAASNVLLTSGPHILRLVIDTGTGVNNNFAGSFNFITIRPASAGTFELTPPGSVQNAGERTQLSLAWTVPVGGWRVLNQIDIRLRDDRGRLIWIRFDEATNTMSMYNSATGKFGPAREVGSYKVRSGPLANLYLRTTTVAAAGPDAPTVVLTLDLKFKYGARGHYTVEAAASDDLGHVDPFAFAGTLDVV